MVGYFIYYQISDTDEVKISDHFYSIPKINNTKYYKNDLVSSFMDAYGIEYDEEIASIFFQADELKSEIEEYTEETNINGIKVQTSLTVIIEPLNNVDEADGWKLRDYVSRDGYPNNNIHRLETEEHIIEPKIAGHYRFHEWGPKSSDWLIVDRDSKDVMARIVLGCNDRSDSKSFTCDRLYRSEKLQMQYTLYKENYHLYKEVDKFIEDKLKSWAVEG